jgi:large subunit ribosomal protein L3
MGHRKKSAPKRGSLAYLPRGRADREACRIRFWPDVPGGGPRLLGFMGYKAGMTHLFYVEDHPGSPNFGKEVSQAVTVVETPPILVSGVRAYTNTDYGLATLTEMWMKDPPKDLERLLVLPENFAPDVPMKKIEENLNQISEFRLLAITQPRLAGLGKKRPELVEIKVGGASLKELFDYARGLLGKTVGAAEVFKEGQFADVLSVSRGKGFQGPVKRWGVRILQNKSRKTVRGVATLGPWNPHRVLYTIPRAGQLGYHRRTEYNKRILKMGVDGKEITPEGGFVRYGVVKSAYLLLEGSVPGPAKRFVRLRYPARPPTRVPADAPRVLSVSLASKQGG